MIWAFLKESGKWWSRSEVLKSFVICVNPFLGICLSVFTFMLSGPGALSLCSRCSVFLISSGFVSGMACVGGTARKSLTSLLVLLWKCSCE